MFLHQHKVIGILGGMGPKATIDLYNHLLNLTQASQEADHIATLIYSNPKIPDRISSFANNEHQKVIHYLQETAKVLETGGADVIIMPCNSAHIYFDPVAASIQVPMINMIEATVKHMVDNIEVQNGVGLLGTSATYDANVYQRMLAAADIELLEPSQSEKQLVAAAIVDIKFGRNLTEVAQLFSQICNQWQAPVIMGCTEIPLVAPNITTANTLINPTEILAKAAIAFIHNSS